LFPSAYPGLQARRKPLNPRPLLSHLTHSNGCGNLQLKVPLTVSPFRPSFAPAIRCVSERAELSSLADPLLTPPTSFLPTFSSPCGLGASMANPVFSSAWRLFAALKKVNSFAIKQIQTLFRKCRGVGGGHPERNYGTPGVGYPRQLALEVLCLAPTQVNNILWNQHLQNCNKTKDFKYVHNQHLCKNRGEG
jgi:hypothetical protein